MRNLHGLRAMAIAAFFLLGAWVTCSASPLSQQCYSMKGHFFVNYGTSSKTTPFEILRSGDTLKITQITEDTGSNYYAQVYVCSNTTALTYSQYGKTPFSAPTIGKPWNNGSVTLSSYKKPEIDVDLSIVWLMVQGGEVRRESKGDFRSVLGTFPMTYNHELPHVSPKTSFNPLWKAGFSSYSETFTNAQQAIQETTFSIEEWTNCAGVQFPRSFVAHVKVTHSTPPKRDVDNHYEFVASQIEELPGTIDTRIPWRSAVCDWRPLEDGTAEVGLCYKTSNGVIHADIIKDYKEKKFEIIPNVSLEQSSSKHPHDYRMEAVVEKLDKRSAQRTKNIGFVVLGSTCGAGVALFWMCKRRR